MGVTNRTVAKQQEAIIKTDLMNGIVKSDAIQGPMTFKALADAYLSSPEIKRQACYQWKDQTVYSRLLPRFGDKLINTVTPGMIEDYREQRRAESGYQGTTIKGAIINRDLPLLKHLFSFAQREGRLERNLVKLVKLEKENNARDRVLSPAEFESLQSHSASHLQAINLMAYQTGMRSGEILNLTWDRVDLKAGLIRLKAEDTKTDDARLVPLTADLTARLKDLYKVRYLNEPHVFLSTGSPSNLPRGHSRPPVAEPESKGSTSTTFGTPQSPICVGPGLTTSRSCGSPGIRRWRCSSGTIASWRAISGMPLTVLTPI